MIRNVLILIFFLTPLLSPGQKNNWNDELEKIKDKKNDIQRIIYYDDSMYGHEADSLAISGNGNIEESIITLYHDEMSMEPDVDYYVVGMDIPIMEFIELEEKEQQISLIFSRKCKPGQSDKKRRLELNLSNQQAKEDLYLTLEEILKIRDYEHQKSHELNQCKIGADY